MELRKVTAIFRRSVQEKVEERLQNMGVKGISVSSVRGYGEYADLARSDWMVSHLKLEISAEQSQADEIVSAILETAHLGRAAGVEIRFGTRMNDLPEQGIVAHGPRRADAISTGYTFETDASDGIFTVASDKLSPAGYAYLLSCGGRGTVATCMFRDFRSQSLCVERTIDFFREKVGLQMQNPRRFSGIGSLYRSGSARRGKLLFAGEAHQAMPATGCVAIMAAAG